MTTKKLGRWQGERNEADGTIVDHYEHGYTISDKNHIIMETYITDLRKPRNKRNLGTAFTGEY